jgi:hypothetical protein
MGSFSVARRGWRVWVTVAGLTYTTLSMIGGAHAVTLITQEEAQLPQSVETVQMTEMMAMRGITRAPAIVVVNPTTGSTGSKSPFTYRVRFEPHNGAHTDLKSLKVTYLKTPNVDLTPRVIPYLNQDGFDVKGAEAPPGDHYIRIDIKDSEGRASSTVMKITIAAP